MGREGMSLRTRISGGFKGIAEISPWTAISGFVTDTDVQCRGRVDLAGR